MEPLKTVLKPIRRGLKVLTQGIKDMQKMLDSIEDSLTSGKTKKTPKAPAKRTKKAPARKSVAKKKPSKRTATDTVLTIIRGDSKGVTSAQIKKRTRFSDTKVRNIIFRLKKQGKIKSRGRGVYVKA